MNLRPDRQLLEFAFNRLNIIGTLFLESIADVPDDDLLTWLPACARHDPGPLMTFSELAASIYAKGRWRLFNQIYGIAIEHPDEAALGQELTSLEIRTRFTDWLSEFHRLLDTRETPDLSLPPITYEAERYLWCRRDYVLNMVGHSALHVGHAQVMSQIWRHERGPGRKDATE